LNFIATVVAAFLAASPAILLYSKKFYLIVLSFGS